MSADIASRSAGIDLDSWLAHLKEKEQECPWPGPRPLRGNSDKTFLLVGREAEQSEFLREVRDRRMVFLTGASGVGKTSLLELGLAKELGDAQYVVGICRDWSGSADTRDAIEFLSAKIAKVFHEYIPPGVSGVDVFWALNRDFPNRCVIVLDQFEELIRDAPALTEGIFPVLAQLNHRSELKIVVSFRSEYSQDLVPLEREVKPFSMSHFSLQQMNPTFAIDVVNAPNADRAAPAVEMGCDTEIVKLWRRAVKQNAKEAKGTRGGRVGLLHLQAILYVLWFMSDGAQVRLSDLEKLKSSGPEGETAHQLFVRTLRVSVNTKIEHCHAASTDVDGWLVDGTLGTLARIVRHLSSGGYKLIRGIGDLAFAALESEFRDLESAVSASAAESGHDGGAIDREAIEILVDAVVDLTLESDREAVIDLLTASTAEIAQAVDQALSYAADVVNSNWSARLQVAAGKNQVDPTQITSGPLLGMPPAYVLIEEIRRFAFAVEWLRASDLARLSTPGVGGSKLALIHDGFGAALTEWSESRRSAPYTVFSALTASRGGEFIWHNDALNPASALNRTRDQPLVVANQRWKGAWVSANLSWVTFVGCDLRGTGFWRCTMEGVTFVNCLLDGVLISDSTIIGKPKSVKEMREGYDHPEPEFRLQASEQLVTALNRYRGTAIDADELHVPLPGLAAVPAAEPDPTALEVRNPAGGLSIVGGRMSALTIRRLTMDDNSAVLLSHVAGSGVDIVEQNGGEFRVEGSALRHLTISSDLVQFNEVDQKGLSLKVEFSNVVQTWISAGLAGEVSLLDSAVIQFWNDSPDVKAKASNCRFYDLVGVKVKESAPFGVGERAASLDETGTDELAQRFRRMAYRRDASRRDEQV